MSKQKSSVNFLDVWLPGTPREYPELFCSEPETRTETGTEHYKDRMPTKRARTELKRLVAELASGVERTVTWRSSSCDKMWYQSLSVSLLLVTFTVFSTALCFLSEALQTYTPASSSCTLVTFNTGPSWLSFPPGNVAPCNQIYLSFSPSLLCNTIMYQLCVCTAG